jgi:primosomal protein N' (replication factor Y)
LALFSGDFRAGEHTFQLLTQVSGRAGRAADAGRVFLQTYNPEHYSLVLAGRGDYEAFYAYEITLRQAMGYPPFSHVFSVLVSGPEEKSVIQALQKLQAVMQYCQSKARARRPETPGNPADIIGLSPAFVSKIKNLYRWKLLLKGSDEETLKRFVLYCVGKWRDNDPLNGLTVHLTMNPVIME